MRLRAQAPIVQEQEMCYLRIEFKETFMVTTKFISGF